MQRCGTGSDQRLENLFQFSDDVNDTQSFQKRIFIVPIHPTAADQILKNSLRGDGECAGPLPHPRIEPAGAAGTATTSATAGLSTDAAEQIRQGDASLSQGRHAEGLAFYKEAARLEPENHLAHFYMGTTSHELGQYVQALEAFNKAIDCKPDEHILYLHRAIALIELGEHIDALSDCNNAVKLQPDHYAGHAGRGMVLRLLGQEAEAILAIKESRKCERVTSDRAMKLSMQGRHDDAISQARVAVEREPDRLYFQVILGRVLERAGRNIEALKIYASAVEINPKAFPVALRIGEVLYKLGRYDEARLSFSDAIKLKPDDPRGHQCLGQVYSKLSEAALAKAEALKKGTGAPA